MSEESKTGSTGCTFDSRHKQSNFSTIITTALMDRRLLKLTSALKAFHGECAEPVLIVSWHWLRNNYQMIAAKADERQEIEKAYGKIYYGAKPLKHAKAERFLDAYNKYFAATATKDELGAYWAAMGYTPFEYDVMREGFSIGELMQALKTLGEVPADCLVACFKMYARDSLGIKLTTADCSELLADYGREPPMKSIEHAKAILKIPGVTILDADNAADMHIWKEASGAREH